MLYPYLFYPNWVNTLLKYCYFRLYDYLGEGGIVKYREKHFLEKQVKLMWTPEALSLFMINLPYLDVEIYNALKNYSRL